MCHRNLIYSTLPRALSQQISLACKEFFPYRASQTMRYSRQNFPVCFLITYAHPGYRHVICIKKQNVRKVYYSKLLRIFALSTLQKLWTGLVGSSWSAVALHTNLANSRCYHGETGKKSIRQCEVHSQSMQSSVRIIYCPLVRANSNFLRFVSSLSQPTEMVINFRGI